MKASCTHLLIWTFLLLNLPTFAQNYQTVQSDEIHYFTTNSYDYVLASKVSEFELQGADSVFYHFQSIRENQNVAPNAYGRYYIGDSWMGSKTIIEADGTNIFYNRDNEPIYIETQAALNDTFLIYADLSGMWIKGTVTHIYPVSIFDEMDSVKVIELSSNQPLAFEEPRIMISKDHGFVKWFAPYTFPEPYNGVASLTNENGFPTGYANSFELVGIDDTMGVHKPEVAEVFDHEIGDEYQFTYKEVALDGSSIETFEVNKIVNKFLYSEDDSVAYFIEKTTQVTTTSTTGQATTEITGPELTKFTAYNLNAWNTSYLPEEYDGTNGWSTLYINACDDLEEEVYKQALINYEIDSALAVDVQGANLTYKVINGVGWLEPRGSTVNGATTYTSDLVFYEKSDGSSCGQAQFLSFEESMNEVMTLELYPNPTDGLMNVRLNQTNSQGFILDQSGRRVKDWQSNTENVQLDVSDLSPGLYTLVIQSDKEFIQGPFVRR